MEFVVNANTIIGIAGLITALGVILGLVRNYFKQVDKWNGYDDKIECVKKKIDDVAVSNDDSIKSLKEEQCIQTEVLLAVLDGLHQQGCNGKVTQATNDLTAYLNKKSHS